jgi:hypothetical protein
VLLHVVLAGQLGIVQLPDYPLPELLVANTLLQVQLDLLLLPPLLRCLTLLLVIEKPNQKHEVN